MLCLKTKKATNQSRDVETTCHRLYEQKSIRTEKKQFPEEKKIQNRDGLIRNSSEDQLIKFSVRELVSLILIGFSFFYDLA